jgi:hypothetical protein
MKIIGIDAGSNTGFAVYDPSEKRLTELVTTDFWGAIEKINAMRAAGEIGVVLEKPKTKANFHKHAKTAAGKHTMGVNVGFALKEAALILEYLNRNGIPVMTLPPLGKKDAVFFKRMTGWSGRTNSHMRDAGLLCFGIHRIAGDVR